MTNMEKYVVFQEPSKDSIWYVSDLVYYPRPEVDWVLFPAECHEIMNAMVFTNRIKAEKIALILSDQFNDFGENTQYEVMETK